MDERFDRIVLAPLAQMARRATTEAYPPAGLGHEYAGRILQMLAHAYLMVFRSPLDAPAFVPFVGDVFIWGAPNADTVMGHASVDPKGHYRIVGTRGTAEIATIMVQAGGPAMGSIGAAVVSELDLDDVPLTPGGGFEVLVSAERPAGHAGPWLTLGDDGATLVTRSITVDAGQRDAAFAIERIDTPPPAQFQGEEPFWQSAGHMMNWADTLLGHIMAAMARKMANPNRDLVYAQQKYGNQTRQHYCEGTFMLAADQCLVLSARVPRAVRYWSVQVLDALFGAIDFVHHQSSLNGRQAEVDDDGVVRIVVSARDPGVANWLDTAGELTGGIMWRWNQVDHQPEVTARLVDLDKLEQALLPGTTRVTPADRRTSLRERATAYQLRRHL